MRNIRRALQQGDARASDNFDDADVLSVEDMDAHAKVNEHDEWKRPRKTELALPTLALLTAASVMALFYHATHPYEIDAPSDEVAYAPWIESPRTITAPAPATRVVTARCGGDLRTAARSGGRVEARRVR